MTNSKEETYYVDFIAKSGGMKLSNTPNISRDESMGLPYSNPQKSLKDYVLNNIKKGDKVVAEVIINEKNQRIITSIKKIKGGQVNTNSGNSSVKNDKAIILNTAIKATSEIASSYIGKAKELNKETSKSLIDFTSRLLREIYETGIDLVEGERKSDTNSDAE